MSLQIKFEEEAQQPDVEQTGKMLLFMAKFGAPAELLASMLNLAMNDKLSQNHSRFLCAPIIQHQSQWMETTPEWMYKAIAYDRLQVVLDEIKSGSESFKVGPIELAIVIYPATMDAPMRYELSQIYLWAAAQANAFHYNKPVEQIYKDLNIPPIPDDNITKPGGQHYYVYRQVCSDIRRKVVNAQIERERVFKKEYRQEKEPELENRPNIQGWQLDLF